MTETQARHWVLQTPGAFAGRLCIQAVQMQIVPELKIPMVLGRDARLFPGVQIDLYTIGDILVPVQRGQIVNEQHGHSYWGLIPQFGRIRHSPAHGPRPWHATFPLMLVNELENHVHQGIASFTYGHEGPDRLLFEFLQQTSPYLLKQHFTASGATEIRIRPLPAQLDVAADSRSAQQELAGRLPARPLQGLISATGTHLHGLGEPLLPRWTVMTAVVRDRTLYFFTAGVPPYPFPQEMRFGVRSILKSVGGPLALLRLAQTQGAHILDLRIGDFVPGLPAKYREVRFVDAANMASGVGGNGSTQVAPNRFDDGYLDAPYDAWYTTASHRGKIEYLARVWGDYPWPAGRVARYRDQDAYLLGAAIDGFCKRLGGADADAWDMLCQEVFRPIGIAHAPVARTIESGGRGMPWFNAGYLPTLDDLAKIALLYQDRGAHLGEQILHRELTAELLSGQGALPKNGGALLDRGVVCSEQGDLPGNDFRSTHYRMGFHFTPYRSLRGTLHYLPTMWGSGESEVVLYPNGAVSIRIGKALMTPPGEQVFAGDPQATARAMDRLDPFP